MKNLIFAIAAFAAIGASSAAMAQSFAHLSPTQVIENQKARQAENAQAEARWSALRSPPAGTVPRQEAGSATMALAS